MKENAAGGILLGCVGDDFTGSSDAASFIANQGVKTLLLSGVPKESAVLEDCAAVVIALKTRSAERAAALEDTRAAFRWLAARGARQFYIKYCSTFDSTPKGNIGTVTDAILEDLGVRYTLLCPSLPVNGRTVRDGRLYVDRIPLGESHMKDHPLNPMWASDIDRLMEPQSKYSCLTIGGALLEKPAEETLARVEEFGEGKEHFYVVPDYEDEAQGDKIAEVFGELRLFTGGSGLLGHLSARLKKDPAAESGGRTTEGKKGLGIILAGSCSKATRIQIRRFKEDGGASLAVDPFSLRSGEQTPEDIWNFVMENSGREVLIYSAGAENPELRAKERDEDQEETSALLEKTMAETGMRAFENGFTRIIVAGGETSGSVTRTLNFDSFVIGRSIAPGVPILFPTGRTDVCLVLKSGNFGQPDFFRRALEMTRG
jgi:uncharacterized protein YgbK (DUF1537 family)